MHGDLCGRQRRGPGREVDGRSAQADVAKVWAACIDHAGRQRCEYDRRRRRPRRARHLPLKDASALVLGGTGPVGQRVARLLAGAGAHVRVGSRQQARAAGVCAEIAARVAGAQLEPVGTSTEADLSAALAGRTLVVAAGAAGVVLLPKALRPATLKVAIDLNAVPPLGIEGVGVADKAVDQAGVICYGAIGVGDTKMKVHKAAVASLFESNDKVLDAEEIYQLAQNY